MADVTLSDDGISRAHELRDVRRQMAELKKIEDGLRKSLIEELGESARALTGSGMPAVHIETQIRRGVNKDRLEAMFPEVFSQVMEEKEVRVLKVDLEELT